MGNGMAEQAYIVTLGALIKEGAYWNPDGMSELIVEQRFGTLAEARALYDELDARGTWLTEKDRRGGLRLMERTGYEAQLLAAEDDCIEAKSYTYDDYRAEDEGRRAHGEI